MTEKAIYSKYCWIEGQLQEATVYFTDTITRVLKGKGDTSAGIIQMQDSIVMPGVIDVHVHVNEPGRTDWEGFETATSAAAAGGVTTIADMPLNASPVTTTRSALHEKMAAAQNKLHVNCIPYGGIVPGNEHEIESLINEGVYGFKAFLTHSGIDEFPNATRKELDTVMPIMAKKKVPLLVHCELSDTAHGDKLRERPTSYNYYLASRPAAWEDAAVDMMIDLCRQYRCAVHIVHVSSASALIQIAAAKAEGLPLTAETCPHYILFSAEEIPDGATMFKCAPPIREKKNNRELKKALKSGILNLIASDHSPAPPELKERSGNFLEAWGGIAGLQFLLAAGWSALRDELTIEQFIPLVTIAPARLLQLEHRKGLLAVGHDADITIWDPDKSFEVKPESVLHKHKLTPYVSRQLFGAVRSTYVNGVQVFDGQTIVQKNKGKWLLRK